MSTLANQPAFPYAFQHEDDANFPVNGISLGMTLRQYYAGKALAGLVGKGAFDLSAAKLMAQAGVKPEEIDAFVARLAVGMADALIAELEKPTP